jgi:hypothetical protein
MVDTTLLHLLRDTGTSILPLLPLNNTHKHCSAELQIKQ